ncbi:MAG TPA: DUF2059 domain-containing protein [Opitutaceae bacterium]|nr:DUF2059 domain-containing protein [Opitutaceae bacterium]
MKFVQLRFVALAFAALTAFAAEPAPAPANDATPELRGVLIAGADQRFALTLPDGASTSWTGIGGSFEGWKLASYNQADGTLVMKKDGREVSIKLAASKVGAADNKATIADAEEVFRKMNFDDMLSKIMDQQKKNQLNVMRQMMARSAPKGASQDEMVALQTKIMDAMFAELKPETLRADFLKAYSEVFTKDELNGLADFYSTPTGQAMTAKQPELQQKIGEIMQPRIMAALPKIQQISQEFQQQQQAKQQAAQSAAAAAPAPAQ